MIVREVVTNAKTGEVVERFVEVPGVLTLDEGMAATTETARQAGNADNLRTQAEQAIANLRAYRDLNNPTNAQTVAAVKLLCRVGIALIRLQLARFDAAD